MFPSTVPCRPSAVFTSCKLNSDLETTSHNFRPEDNWTARASDLTLWCLFCPIRFLFLFPFFDVQYSVKGICGLLTCWDVWRGSIWRTELSLLWLNMHIVMVQKTDSNTWQENSIDYISKTRMFTLRSPILFFFFSDRDIIYRWSDAEMSLCMIWEHCWFLMPCIDLWLTEHHLESLQNELKQCLK